MFCVFLVVFRHFVRSTSGVCCCGRHETCRAHIVGERREDGGGEKTISNILGKTTSLFCMCAILSPRSCLRGTPGSRVGGPVSHDWTFPAFKFGRGLLVLVLVEEKSTARQQNVFRSPMPLPKFCSPVRSLFGPRCLRKIFASVRVACWSWSL